MAIMGEVIAVVLAHAIVAWLFTYLLHGTVMVLLAAVLERVLVRVYDDAAVRAALWRTAIVAPLLTASVHTALPFGSPLRISTQPAGAVLGPHPALAVVIVALWCALIAWRVLGFARAERRARSTLGARIPVTDARQLQSVATLAQHTGLRSVPGLTGSAHVHSPAALVPNEICIPTTIFATLAPEEQHALLAHEIAHIARRDPLWCGLAALATHVCFFHPLTRLALRRLKHATEHAADARALRHIDDARALARALAALAPHVLQGAIPRIAATGSPLVARIRRILDRAPSPMPMPRLRVAALITLVIAACLALGPGVNFTPRNAANSIPSLTPSPQPPSPQLLELRVLQRRVRESQRTLVRQ